MTMRPRLHRAASNAPKRRHVAQYKRVDRDYSLSSVFWARLRAMVLSENPLCVACDARGRVTAAREVDHVNSDPNDNARTNLQGLCTPCHSRKTAQEVNARTRAARTSGRCD